MWCLFPYICIGFFLLWRIPAFRPVNPFPHIQLQDHNAQVYLNVGGVRIPSRVRFFWAHRKVHGPVNQKQFILFTRSLFKQAMHRYNDPRHPVNQGMRPLTYAPRCAGLLMGNGENMEYNFVSETRPNEVFDPSATGGKLYVDSFHKQITRKYPDAWQRAGDTMIELHDAVQDCRQKICFFQASESFGPPARSRSIPSHVEGQRELRRRNEDHVKHHAEDRSH